MGIEGFRELLKSSRSIRRYDSSVKISREELMAIPSGAIVEVDGDKGTLTVYDTEAEGI